MEEETVPEPKLLRIQAKVGDIKAELDSYYSNTAKSDPILAPMANSISLPDRIKDLSAFYEKIKHKVSSKNFRKTKYRCH